MEQCGKSATIERQGYKSDRKEQSQEQIDKEHEYWPKAQVERGGNFDRLEMKLEKKDKRSKDGKSKR